MKVLHLTWGALDLYGGIETEIALLRSHAQHFNCDQIVRRLPSINSHHLRGDSDRLPTLGFREALASLLKDEKVTVIHSHNIHRPHGPGVAAAVTEIARLTNTPHVATVHDIGNLHTTSDEKERVMSLLLGAVTVGTSPFNCQCLASEYDIHNAEMIPPAIDFSCFSDSSEPEPNTICYPSRFTLGKGLLYAIPILELLSREVGPLRLLLSDRKVGAYGESSSFFAALDETISRCTSLDIEFLHEPRVIPYVYSRAQLCLFLPLGIEGFGLTPLEGLASCRPVVASVTGGMTWLSTVSGTRLVNSGSILEIAEFIVTTIRDWRHWHHEASKGREQLRHIYDVEVVLRQYIDIYERASHRLRRVLYT